MPGLRSKVDRGNQLSLPRKTLGGFKKLSRAELIPHKVEGETIPQWGSNESAQMSASFRYRQGVDKLAVNLNRIAKEDNCAQFRKVIQKSIVKELQNFNIDQNRSTKFNESSSEEVIRAEWV